MSRLSPESKQKKSKMVSAIRTWISLHRLAIKDAAVVLDVNKGNLGQWLLGHSAPYLGAFDDLKQRMAAFDQEHLDAVPGSQQRLRFEDRKEQGIQLTISGKAGSTVLQFEKIITVEQAGQIISQVSLSK